jgi:hypothetical protein
VVIPGVSVAVEVVTGWLYLHSGGFATSSGPAARQRLHQCRCYALMRSLYAGRVSISSP